MNPYQALLLIASGAVMALGCFIVGAWVMYRGKSVPGTGEGFLKDPKGEVFTIQDDLLNGAAFPGGDKAEAEDEKGLLKRTEKFLEVLGGGRNA